MARRVVFCIMVLLFGVVCVKSVCAGEEATPEEVYRMVVKASEVLQVMGAEAIPEFNDPKGEFVWKDSYVFVADCTVPTAVAHPFIPALVGPDQSNLQGAQGHYFVADLCKATEDPNGGWTEYWWPKPGYPRDQAFRKISFSIDVPGQPYQLSAGIYNEAMSVDELNATLR